MSVSSPTPAAWTAWTASWTNTDVVLSPGLNRVLVQAFDENGLEFERAYADIWYDDGDVAAVSGTVAVDTTWVPEAEVVCGISKQANKAGRRS